MMNDQIVFVILNYNLFNEVVECINSIKSKIDTEQYHIIVIDNCSPNGNGQNLYNHYILDKKVVVKVLSKNLGFAKGNNIGIEFARKAFSPKYICCLNNDILFIDNKFFNKLDECFIKTNAAVIAPKVFLKDASIQPVIAQPYSINFYKHLLASLSNVGWRGGIYKIKQYLKKFYIIRYIYKKIKLKPKELLDPNFEHKNILLHGCCLIFTPTFFERLKGFNPKTFMFREEELLFLSLKKNNLENIYCPKLEIKHLEDVSTNVSYKTNKEKENFLRENQLKSLKILIDELEIYEKGK